MAHTSTPSRTVTPVVQHWPTKDESVPLARDVFRKALNDWGLAGVADAAALVLCELMTNALRHASSSGGDIEIRYEPWAEGGVRVEVWDGDSAHLPRLRGSSDEAEHGRGLQLVQSLTAGRWGSEPCRGQGKLVWANLSAC